jgi:protocatechuate 3,4-dioxygenase beta subunit
MRSRSTAALIRPAVVILLVTACPAKAEQLPDADSLFERAIEARGGREAILARHALHLRSKIELPTPHLSGTTESWAKTPNLSRSVLRLENGVVIEQGFDGQVGWVIGPQGNKLRKDPIDIETLKRSQNINEELYYKDNFKTRRTVEKTLFEDGRAVYRVEAKPPLGPPVTKYFEVETGLPAGTDYEDHSGPSPILVKTRYSDFRRVGDLVFAHHLVSEGTNLVVLNMELVEFDPKELPSFELPSPFRARSIIGRVLIDGKPAPSGVKVEMSNDLGDEREPRSADTDPTGAFRIDDAPMNDRGGYRLLATSATYTAYTNGTFPESGDATEVVLDLKPGGRIDFNVVGPDGRGVPHATLTCIDGDVICGDWRTDLDGHAAVVIAPWRSPLQDTLPEEWPPPVHSISISAPGFRRTSAEREFTLSKSKKETIRLDRAATASGRVLDEARRPVADVEVALEKWFGPGKTIPGGFDLPARFASVETVRTDKDGRFAFRQAEPGKSRIVIRGRGPQEKREIDLPKAGIELMVEGSGSVSGIVLGGDGKPISGAGVVLEPAEETHGESDDSIETRGDGSGRFRIERVPAGEYTITAYDPQLRNTKASVHIAKGGSSEVVIRFGGALSITGLVLDEDGRPYAGVPVEGRPPLNSKHTPDSFFHASAVTGTDGRFALSDLPAGPVEIDARTQTGGSFVVRSARSAAGSNGVRIVMPRLVEIKGRVVGPEGRALEQFEIGSNSLQVRDAAGMFRQGVNKDTREIWIVASGLAPSRVALPSYDGKSSIDLGTIKLDHGRTIRGRVVSRDDGRPLEASVAPVPYRLGATVTADKKGEFVLGNLPLSAVRLEVQAQGFLKQAVTIARSEDRLNVELEQGAVVAGRVIDREGKPVPKIGVHVGVDQFSYELTDDVGRFEISGVAAGKTVLMVEERTIRMKSEGGKLSPVFERPEVEVPAVGRIEIEIKERSGVDVHVRTLDADGAPIERAEFSLVAVDTRVPSENDSFNAIFRLGYTSGLGRGPESKTIRQVPAGRYLLILRVTSMGGTAVAHEVVTVDAEHSDLEIRLPIDPMMIRHEGMF